VSSLARIFIRSALTAGLCISSPATGISNNNFWCKKMRIISGKARGLKLRAPDGLDTRPTADRIKESLFNMLAPDLPGCRFLDLFGGTGAIGIEALSRGAALAVFADNSSVAVGTIKKNLAAAKLADGARVLYTDFKDALGRLASEGQKFDIIFLDPPYHTTFAEEALSLIAAEGLLDDDGYAVVETERGAALKTDGLQEYKMRNYGSASLVFLR